MKTQFKLFLDEEIIGRLEKAANRYGRRSANEVAVEVITQYLDFWEYAESAKHAVFEQQRAFLVETERVPVIGPPEGPKGTRPGKAGRNKR